MVEECKAPVNATQHSIDILDSSSMHMKLQMPETSSTRSGLGLSSSKITAPLLSESMSRILANASGEEAKGGGHLRFSVSSICQLSSKLSEVRWVDAALRMDMMRRRRTRKMMQRRANTENFAQCRFGS